MFQFFWWSRQSNAPISGPRLFLERLLGPSEGKTRVLKKTLGITGRWDTNCQESQNSADSSCWFQWCLITECMVRNMIVTFSEDSWNTAELSSSVVSISSTLSGETASALAQPPSPCDISTSPRCFTVISLRITVAAIASSHLPQNHLSCSARQDHYCQPGFFYVFLRGFEWFEIDGNINR